jgi:hypothetical protein
VQAISGVRLPRVLTKCQDLFSSGGGLTPDPWRASHGCCRRRDRRHETPLSPSGRRHPTPVVRRIDGAEGHLTKAHGVRREPSAGQPSRAPGDPRARDRRGTAPPHCVRHARDGLVSARTPASVLRPLRETRPMPTPPACRVSLDHICRRGRRGQWSAGMACALLK